MKPDAHRLSMMTIEITTMPRRWYESSAE